MFFRSKIRWKNGKAHRYWSVVENRRAGNGRVVQRHVLYLGEINDTQALAWRKSIDVLDEEAGERCRCFPRMAARDFCRMPRRSA